MSHVIRVINNRATISRAPPTPPTPTLPHRSQFTDTALSLSLTLLNAFIDLISFSGILFSIYPPLFVALILYSLGGTAVSIALGKVRLWVGEGVAVGKQCVGRGKGCA